MTGPCYAQVNAESLGMFARRLFDSNQMTLLGLGAGMRSTSYLLVKELINTRCL